MLRAAATMRGAGSAVLHGRPPRAGSGLIDAVHGPPRPGSGLLHGVHGRHPRAGSGLIDAVHGPGSGLLHGVHGPPRPGSGLLHGVHGPPRPGSGLLHGVLAGLRGPTHPRAGAAAVLYNSTGLGASGAYLKGVRGLPRAGAPYTLLNGVHGYSRAEYAGCTLALFTIQRRMSSSSSMMATKRYFDRKCSFNFNTKRHFSSNNNGNIKARLQAMWSDFLEYLKTAPTTVLNIIQDAQAAVEAKWICLMNAPAALRAKWEQRCPDGSFCSFMLKVIMGSNRLLCRLFEALDQEYKRFITYLPLIAAVCAVQYLNLTPMQMIDFLHYHSLQMAFEIIDDYEAYQRDHAIILVVEEPNNNLKTALEEAQVALKDAQNALVAALKIAAEQAKKTPDGDQTVAAKKALDSKAAAAGKSKKDDNSNDYSEGQLIPIAGSGSNDSGSSDDSDDNDESEDEEEEKTPKKGETGKKRGASGVLKTPSTDEKSKVATPSVQKTADKNGAVHPAKKTCKTPATNEKSPKSGGSVLCKSCPETFNSENALAAHSNAKHKAAAPK